MSRWILNNRALFAPCERRKDWVLTECLSSWHACVGGCPCQAGVVRILMVWHSSPAKLQPSPTQWLYRPIKCFCKKVIWGDGDCMAWRLAWSEEDLLWSTHPNKNPNMTITRACNKTLACIRSFAAQQIAECIQQLLSGRTAPYIPAHKMRFFAFGLTMKLTCSLQARLELELEWHNTNAPGCRLERLPS